MSVLSLFYSYTTNNLNLLCNQQSNYQWYMYIHRPFLHHIKTAAVIVHDYGLSKFKVRREEGDSAPCLVICVCVLI